MLYLEFLMLLEIQSIPPVDLSNLNINFINKIRVDKKELREEYGNY
ncbi:hypothetical protein V3317_03925 [Mycoplasmopsis felis]